MRKENGEWYRVDIGIPSKESVEAASFYGKLTVVKRLNGRSEANAVAQWLRKEAGVS